MLVSNTSIMPQKDLIYLSGIIEKLDILNYAESMQMLIKDIINGNFYLSYSSISKFAISAGEYLTYKYAKKTPTEKMVLGSLFEDLIFNETIIQDRYLICPCLEYRSNKDKQIYFEYTEMAKERNLTLIKLSSYNKVLAAAQIAKAQIPELLENCEYQKRIDTKILDVPIVGYIDVINSSDIVDIKYTYNPDNVDNIYNRNWYMQMALYYLSQGCEHNCYIYAFSNEGLLYKHKLSVPTLVEGITDIKLLVSEFLEWILKSSCNKP